MTGSNKPYAEACDQNREPILSVLEPLLTDRKSVLEIGSGTGQHAVYFGAQFPQLDWYASDRQENHTGIRMWLDEAGLRNVHGPLQLDVTQTHWPALTVDAVFSANTLHIMAWTEVVGMFRGLPSVLKDGSILIIYGPFNYHGSYTSESNERFDAWLKARDPHSGIRDVDDLNALANAVGLQLVHDYSMPVNNRILHWQYNPVTV